MESRLSYISYEFFDPSIREDIVEYEKGLYSAFMEKNPDSEHLENWELSGEK